MVPGAVARAFAFALAAASSPSKKVVVMLTTTDPGTMLSILTETLLFGYAISIVAINCVQHPELSTLRQKHVLYTKVALAVVMLAVILSAATDVDRGVATAQSNANAI